MVMSRIAQNEVTRVIEVMILTIMCVTVCTTYFNILEPKNYFIPNKIKSNSKPK